MTNLFGLPGLGSIAAGRPSGYAQMVLSLGGLALTSIFAIRAFMWLSSSNGSQHDVEAVAIPLGELWIHVRWALLGFGVFLCGWLWAFATGLSILAEARSTERTPSRDIPPKLLS